MRLLQGGKQETRSSEGQAPPHDIEAEGAVLGAVIVDGDALTRLSGFLRPTHFYSDAHQRIFEACLALREAGTPIDIVLVASWLKDRQRLEQVGGIPYIATVVSSWAGGTNVVEYAAIVYEKWREREAIRVCQRAAAEGYLDHGDTQAFLDHVVHDLANIARAGTGAPVESNGQALRRILKSALEAASSDARDRLTGIPTGIAPLDALMHGLHSSQKTTIAALTGRGKTTCALQIAKHVASQGIGVLMFTLEQPREELLRKLLTNEARVDSSRLKAGKLTDSEIDRILTAQPVLEKLPIWFADDPDMHVGQIRQIAMAHAERTMLVDKVPVGLVIVDYVQRMRAAPEVANAKLHERIGHATRGLKLLAQEMRIPLIEIAQQKTTEIDKVTKKRPRPATGSVADSSQVEKEADNVIYLHREPMVGASGRIVGEDPRAITFIIDKQRGGATGEIRTTFEQEFARFVPIKDEDDEFDYGDRP